FGRQGQPRETATVTEESISEGLRRSGLGQEFMGRIQHLVLFRSLTDDNVREIIVRQLRKLEDLATARGKRLSWTESAVARLSERWKSHPHLGARYLGTLVRVQILDPLNVAAAAGELNAVSEIVVDAEGPTDAKVARSDRHVEGERLRIVLR